MRPLIYSMAVSLDGYIAGPRAEIDWAAPGAELHRFHNQQARELDLHLLGRRLYEVMTYWETAEERNPSARAGVRADLEAAIQARVLELAAGGRRKQSSPAPTPYSRCRHSKSRTAG